MNCLIQGYHPNQLIADGEPINGDGQYQFSLSGVIRLQAAAKILLKCAGPLGHYATTVAGPGQISVTRIGLLTTGTATTP
jgi:hypothetical protein